MKNRTCAAQFLNLCAGILEAISSKQWICQLPLVQICVDLCNCFVSIETMCQLKQSLICVESEWDIDTTETEFEIIGQC